jgi:hypothetical protein
MRILTRTEAEAFFDSAGGVSARKEFNGRELNIRLEFPDGSALACVYDARTHEKRYALVDDFSRQAAKE